MRASETVRALCAASCIALAYIFVCARLHSHEHASLTNAPFIHP